MGLRMDVLAGAVPDVRDVRAALRGRRQVGTEDRDRAPRFDREPAERRADDTDVLERRIADLEERLDFTERLLAKRTESTA